MAYNSTIKQKRCKEPNCNNWPYLGMAGLCLDHAAPELLAKKRSKAKDAAKRAQTNAIARNLHKQQEARMSGSKIENGAKIALKRPEKKTHDGRADLLQKADLRFSRYMRNKYSNENGDIICPLCFGKYNIEDRLEGSETVVQVLHFIPRGVMSLRFAENTNTKLGCTFCNLQMHLEPNGRATIKYRELLVKEIGEEKVLEMESEKYKVNKVSHAYLKEICELYDPRKHPVKVIQQHLED